jgi:hypothetical protein
VIVDLLLNADTPFRRPSIITGIMIASDKQERTVSECHKKLQIIGIQVAAGDDQIYIFQLFRGKIVPK